MAAALPVPYWSTVSSIEVSVVATSGGSTRLVVTRLRSVCAPSESGWLPALTSWMPTGAPGSASVPLTRSPPWAIVSYACAMSSGVTPTVRPPMVIAGLVESGVVMPILRASRAMREVPTRRPTSA